MTILVGDYPAPPEYGGGAREFGLDRPLPERLGRYLLQLGQGNLGYSFANQPVRDLIGGRLGAALQLTLTAMALATVVGVALGVIAPGRGDGPGRDRPAAPLRLLPPGVLAGADHDPALRRLAGVAPLQGNRSLRAPVEGWGAVTDGMRYLCSPPWPLLPLHRPHRPPHPDGDDRGAGGGLRARARARGAGERTVLLGHALRHAALPVLTVVGYNWVHLRRVGLDRDGLRLARGGAPALRIDHPARLPGDDGDPAAGLGDGGGGQPDHGRAVREGRSAGAVPLGSPGRAEGGGREPWGAVPAQPGRWWPWGAAADLLLALAAPLVTAYDPLAGSADALLPPLTPGHLGTDHLGRDVWSQLVYGARVSLAVGLLAALSATLLGTAVGAAAGYAGGWPDGALMRRRVLPDPPSPGAGPDRGGPLRGRRGA